MKKSDTYFTLQWHITEKCDQRCKHCYIFRGNDKNISFDVDKENCFSIIKNFNSCCEKMNCLPYFVITGGDPILSDNFWYILEKLKSQNTPFSVLGNPFRYVR